MFTTKIDATKLVLQQHNDAATGIPCVCDKCKALYHDEAVRCGVTYQRVVDEVAFFMTTSD